jgi:hypothetical protein
MVSVVIALVVMLVAAVVILRAANPRAPKPEAAAPPPEVAAPVAAAAPEPVAAAAPEPVAAAAPEPVAVTAAPEPVAVTAAPEIVSQPRREKREKKEKEKAPKPGRAERPGRPARARKVRKPDLEDDFEKRPVYREPPPISIVGIGNPHLRPDPERFIQTEVIVRAGMSGRVGALSRLALTVAIVGGSIGLVVIMVGKIVGAAISRAVAP